MVRVAVEIMAMVDVGSELVKSEYQQSGTFSIDLFSALCFKYVYSTRFMHLHTIPKLSRDLADSHSLLYV